jgi:hypothetical protein
VHNEGLLSPGQNARVTAYRLARCPWRERQVDEIPDRYNPGGTELPQPKQILVFADDEVRFGGGSAFEDAVVVRVLFDDMRVSAGET